MKEKDIHDKKGAPGQPDAPANTSPKKESQEPDILEKVNPDGRKQGKSKYGHSSRMTLWILIIVAAIIVLGLASIFSYMVDGSANDVTIRIPKNATIENVSDSLNKYFPEDYSNKVLKLLKVANFEPEKRHGSYLLPKGATPFATMRKIARGAQDPIRITINGFRTIDYLGERIGKKMEFTPEEFVKAAKDPEFLAQYGLTPDNALSLFLDDTYEVYWTSTPQEVLKKIGDNYNAFWSEGRRKQAADLDVTPAEMMILASIVDDETNQVLEKGRIGRLYINRLDKGMKLQADPTVRVANGDLTIRRVTKEHLKVDNPYNTYIYEGLPPGPLRTTSRKTITEILNSKPSTDLYMCAREDFSGFHNFADNYEDHKDNARRYQDELDKRGIK